MTDEEVLREVFKVERERKQLEGASIDPAMKERLMKVIDGRLASLKTAIDRPAEPAVPAGQAGLAPKGAK